MGCLLRPPSKQKRKSCGGFLAKKEGVWCDLGEKKVPTCGFSAKKEGVWHDLSEKGADSWIFGKKGSRVAQPPCHFSQLGKKGRWVVQPQQGKVLTCKFSAKKEIVWHDLPAIFQDSAKKEGGWHNLKNLPEILYCFDYQYRLNAP